MAKSAEAFAFQRQLEAALASVMSGLEAQKHLMRRLAIDEA